MISSLTELTMRDYISLVCGDVSVLRPRSELIRPDKLQRIRARLMFEFARLSDEAGTKSAINQRKASMSSKAEVTFFKVCNNLARLGAFAELRPILAKYGLDEKRMTDRQIEMEVSRLLKRAETEAKRQASGGNTEGDRQTPADIRRHFDRQAAMLMTYFKFQIDLATIPASQFACMIDQANREIKAKMSAMAKR